MRTYILASALLLMSLTVAAQTQLHGDVTGSVTAGNWLHLDGQESEGPRSDTPIVLVYSTPECASGGGTVVTTMPLGFSDSDYHQCLVTNTTFHYRWFKTAKEALDAANGEQLTVVAIMQASRLAFSTKTAKVRVPQPDKVEDKTTYRLQSDNNDSAQNAITGITQEGTITQCITQAPDGSLRAEPCTAK